VLIASIAGAARLVVQFSVVLAVTRSGGAVVKRNEQPDARSRSKTEHDLHMPAL
jgi:hypothetical protein